MQKRIYKFISAMLVVWVLSVFYVPVQAAEFTADWVNIRKGQTHNGKTYVKDAMICIEVLEGPELGIIITDQKKRASILMLPDQKIYVEIPKNLSILEPDHDIIAGAEKKHVGTETLNHRVCDKYQYVKPGTDTVMITQWVAKDLHYPVKIVYHGEEGNTAEVKNIQEGPVDTAMFQVRTGYTKNEVGKVGKLTTAQNGKKEESINGGNLGISNIVFCSKRPEGHMAYNEQPAATYKPGDTVWTYMNLDGVSHRPNPNGSKETWIKMHLKVKSPNGDLLLDQDLLNEHKNYQEQFNMDTMFFKLKLNSASGMAEGRYTIELELRDNLSGEQASVSSIFTLKK